eukprot:Opistho-2@5428
MADTTGTAGDATTCTAQAAVQPLRVLEFYSGIGGMHCALRLSGVSATVVAAFDINTTANAIYTHNFDTQRRLLRQRNIEALSARDYDGMRGDVWLMSPPCQPFTRVGMKRDNEDPRTKSFLHLLAILPKMEHPPRYILVENVAGFETSATHAALISTLDTCGFAHTEHMLTPLQLGIPNSRLRFFLLARRTPISPVSFPTAGSVPCAPIASYLEEGASAAVIEACRIPAKIVCRSGGLFDIVTPQSVRSCCFTKAYGHYVEGTGSVLQPHGTREEHEELWQTHAAQQADNDKGSADASPPMRTRTRDDVNEDPEGGDGLGDDSECQSPAKKARRDADTDADAPVADAKQKTAAKPSPPSAQAQHAPEECPLSNISLRYFTPREVANIQGFPRDYEFPAGFTARQCYRVLG